MTSHIQPDEPDRPGTPLAPLAAGDSSPTDSGRFAPQIAGDSRSESPTLPPAAPKRGRWLWIAAGIVLAVLIGGAAAAVWWWFWPPAPPAPPMPADIQEPEVRDVIEAARQNVLQKPRSADAWGLLGMTLLTNLFTDDADRCFVEAARLDPRDARWPYARGLIALKRDPDHALDLLQRAADLPAPTGDQSRYRLQLAEALVERQRLNEAEKLFRQELNRPGDNARKDDAQIDAARAAYGLGLIAVARGDRAAALPYLTTAYASPYAKKKAAAQLAALARARGDDAGAAAYEKEWAELPNDSPWPDPLLDRILDLQAGHRRREREVTQLELSRHYQEAADIYLQQIEEDPNNAAAHTGAGMDLFRLGQYDRAFPLLRDGARLDPASPQAHYSLAQALFARAEKGWQEKPGDAALADGFREAVEHARRAAELKPDHAQAYLLWGMSLKYLGKPAEAVAPLRKGVDCRPEHQELQLQLGEALMESGQPKEAETYLENARRLSPPDDLRAAHDLERLHQSK